MSKFRDTPPLPPGQATDDKVIAFPASGEMTLEQRKAELAAFDRAASAELMLRIKYSTLKSTLDTIDRYEPVPDDWRARLLAREAEEDGKDL
ncbi:hypothetical protein ACN2C6_16540 [Caulobacter sp. ErkDOM-YI]|uniref:hypothetical protein n=1 Tax=unclassified Caulobacter TaxID=2648921 RepID=UPI003AF8C004